MGERLTEVTIKDQVVQRGWEVTLDKSPGRRKGRYQFEWAELDRKGNVILSVYGPLHARVSPHYRLAAVSCVLAVHPKTD